MSTLTKNSVKSYPSVPAVSRQKNKRYAPRRLVLSGVMILVSLVILVPIVSIVLNAFLPNSAASGIGIGGRYTIDNFVFIFGQTDMPHHMGNSFIAATVTTLMSIMVGAPAGYVLSRARSKAVSGYSLLLFAIQSLPMIVFVIPLFIVFAALGLVDTIAGVCIVYVAIGIPIACWTMASYFDTIPTSLEEAAWMDGCSIVGGFVRVVLRNSGPGLLSVGILSFLLAWNDYFIALVFLRSKGVLTLPLGMQQFFQQNQAEWGYIMASAVLMMIPPVLLFAFFSRYFSVGGTTGSLAGN